MKRFSKWAVQFLVVFCVAAGIFLLVNRPQDNPACGQVCPCTADQCVQPFSVAESIAQMAEGVGSAMMEMAQDFISGFSDIMEDLHENMQDDLQELSQQDRTADVERGRYAADLANVELANNYRMTYEGLQVEIMEQNPPPSQLVCREVQMDRLRQGVRLSNEVNQAEWRERARRRSGRTGGGGGGGGGGGPGNAPIMYDECIDPLNCHASAFNLTAEECDPSEHNGNADFCQGPITDPRRVISAEAPSRMVEEGITIQNTPENVRALTLGTDYVDPGLAGTSNPLRPGCMENDATCPEFYFNDIQTRALASFRSENVVDSTARIMESLPGEDCNALIALYRHFHSLEGTPAPAFEACPSLEQMRYYEMLMMESSYDMSEIFTDHGTNLKIHQLNTLRTGLRNAFAEWQRTLTTVQLNVMGVQQQAQGR